MRELSIVEAAREVPDAVAVIAAGIPYTYREIAARAQHAIAWLEERGIVAGDERLVAVVARSTLRTLDLVYALLELGVTSVLLHPRLTAAERSFLVEDARPALVVEDTALASPFSSHATEGLSRPPVDHPRERPLTIVYTSGSSGRPKGVVLTRGAFLAAARASEANLGFYEGDRWLLCMPQGHVGGFSIVIRCLVARRTVVIPASVVEGRSFDADDVLATLERDRVTLVSVVPTMLAKMLERPNARIPSHVRAILLGGAGAPASLLAACAAASLPVLTTYGMTEAASQVTTQAPGTRPGPEQGSGRPLPEVEVRIADGGVVEVRSPALMRGYFPLGAHPNPLDEGGWFRTGDLGALDAEGRLHIVGRAGDLIITGGENVHPTEVERVLERCPGVSSSCVFSVPDEQWGDLVAAAIVATDRELASANLERHLAEHLSSHKRPRRVAWLDELATNAVGKVDRRATRSLASSLLSPWPPRD